MEDILVVRNEPAFDRQAYEFGHIQSIRCARIALAQLRQCPHYRRTPLLELENAALQAGVARVYYKDESARFGIGSFKAIGGGYAVASVLVERIGAMLGRKVEVNELFRDPVRALAAALTFTCASDGNHGRAVAAAAQAFGAKCVVFLHEGVSPGREGAIRFLGARVVRTAGNYDDSLKAAAAAADENGWIRIADTTDDPADPTAAVVMQGYGIMALEVVDQLIENHWPSPTHVILQGGVGGLAAAMAAFFWEYYAQDAPIFIIVEPERADCLLRSAVAGAPRTACGDLSTVMAGLSCGEVSRAAWPIIAKSVEFFTTVSDSVAIDAMRMLANGSLGAHVEAGESGAAGVAALFAVARTPRKVRLSAESRVLVFGTEGATDPAIYKKLVGVPASCAAETV